MKQDGKPTRVATARGAPAAEDEGASVLVLDVGASRIKGALVTPAGTRRHEIRSQTGRGLGPEFVLGRVTELALDLSRRLSPSELGAVAVAVCGTVGPSGDVTAVNLGWSGVDLGARVGTTLGRPVTVVNDAHAGAVGEGRYGAAQDSDDYLYVSLGTGIGAAIVESGAVVYGAHGQAGELGHIRVDPDGRECACGARGCLQTAMSAVALEGKWAAANGSPLSAWEILDLVLAGDTRARSLWLESVAALASGLITAMTLIDPRVIVLGGGLSRAGDSLLVPLGDEIARQARPFHSVAELRLASLADWSACAGAAYLARQGQGQIAHPPGQGAG